MTTLLQENEQIHFSYFDSPSTVKEVVESWEQFERTVLEFMSDNTHFTNRLVQKHQLLRILTKVYQMINYLEFFEVQKHLCDDDSKRDLYSQIDDLDTKLNVEIYRFTDTLENLEWKTKLRELPNMNRFS